MGEQRIDLLTLLDAFVRTDAAPPGLIGDLAVGVMSSVDRSARWWCASFGARVKLELTAQYPKNADAVLLLSEADAQSILHTGSLRQTGKEVYFTGNKLLMKKFLERYL